MPLGTLYKVVTRYETDTREAETRVERLARRVERQQRVVERAEKSWGRFGGVVKGALVGGALLGVGMLTRRMIGLTRTAEDARIGIAAVFEQTNPGNWQGNLNKANDLFERFSVAAIKSPATQEQFRELFTAAAPAVASLGLDNDTLTKFASRGVPAAMAFTGGDFSQAGRDFMQILQGRAGTDVRTWNSLKKDLLRITGTADTEAFNKAAQANPAKVFDALMKTLETMDVVNQEFATSFGGLISSAVEFGDMFLRAIGGPLVKELKFHLIELVGWFERNQEAVKKLGEDIGKWVGGAITGLVNTIKLAANNAEILVASLTAITLLRFANLGALKVPGAGRASGGAAAAVLGGKASGGAGGALKFAGTLVASSMAKAFLGRHAGRIGRFVGGQVGLAITDNIGGSARDKLAGVVAHAVSGGIGALGGKGQMMAALGSGGAAAGAGKAGLMGALALGFAKLLLIIPPLIVIVAMVAGTFRVLKDETNEATQFLKQSWMELLAALDAVAIMLTGGDLSTGMKSFLDWLGTGVVGVLGLAVKAAERLVIGFTYLIAFIKGIAYTIGDLINQIQTGGIMSLGSVDLSAMLNRGMDAAFKEREEAERKAIRDRLKKEAEEKKKKDAEDVEAGGAKPPNVNVTVHQNITTDANPDRIAFKIADVIQDTARKFPRSAVGVGAR